MEKNKYLTGSKNKQVSLVPSTKANHYLLQKKSNMGQPDGKFETGLVVKAEISQNLFKKGWILLFAIFGTFYLQFTIPLLYVKKLRNRELYSNN